MEERREDGKKDEHRDLQGFARAQAKKARDALQKEAKKAGEQAKKLQEEVALSLRLSLPLSRVLSPCDLLLSAGRLRACWLGTGVLALVAVRMRGSW